MRSLSLSRASIVTPRAPLASAASASIVLAFSIFSVVFVGCTTSPESPGARDASVDDAAYGAESSREVACDPCDPFDAAVAPQDGGIDANADAPPRLPDGAAADAASDSGDSGCGYGGKGTPLHIADNVDLCLPPVVCTSETCPPTLGRCEAGVCTFLGAYKGLQTQPESWATYYCTLSTGGCHGVTQVEFPEVTAANVAKAKGLPLCEGATDGGPCIGIAASSPMVVGNSQLAIDPATGKTVSPWGLGLTEASGLCYAIEGPGGAAIVALTDRCGGYCKCGGSGYQECGPCVSAPDMEPNCACVGAVPGLPAPNTECCGRGCATTKADCDWCASNNHPHFDLDTGTFNHLCGADGVNGSCKITKVAFVPCMAPSSAWPPGGGGGAACKKGAFQCSGGATPHFAGVPGTGCCCEYDKVPQGDGSCI